MDPLGSIKEVFIVIVLVLMNGLLAMLEMALVSARKSRLEQLADEGSSKAAYILKLAQEPTEFLSTVQIGITLVGIGTGVSKGSGHSGLISISRCGQEVLERTACALDPEHGDLLLRLEVGFPANGRTINARELEKILFDLLPRCVEESLLYRNLDGKRLQEAADLAEDQQDIRRQLPALGLCAFVADGSILPRTSGVSSLDRKSTRLNSSHTDISRMPSSA